VNYSEYKKAEAIPEAASMIETFRAIGYSLETAIADIIDNSISANAGNIYINRIWRGGKSVITIKDDGEGMNGNEIIQAMRPGAQNPLSDRSETDLGRFGLGLKTASFSQCRKLSVLSKRRDYKPAFWSWDLDYVAESDKWELLQWIPEEFTGELDSLPSGTLIVWSDLDRVLPPQTAETDDSAKRKFSDALDKVKNHIAMIFHRFIEDKAYEDLIEQL
jgi:anti-sigma regulatory factor (Ser/Thr protein kinase)